MIIERDIEAVLNRADIVDVVERCGVHLLRGNKACCPFHNERTPSFHVNPRTQSWHCFGGCPQGDNGGDAINFLMKYKNVSFPEAVKQLANMYGMVVEEKNSVRTAEEVAASKKRDAMLMVNAWAAKFFADALTADNDKARFALDYAISKRGWGAEYVAENGIGFADGARASLFQAAIKAAQPIDLMIELGLLRRDEHGEVYDFYRDRLVIPIRDRFRRVIGFTARALGESKAKYINSPTSAVYEKKNTIFGIDNAITMGRRENIFYLVEGAPDVIKLQAVGITNTVASLGGAWSTAHFQQLRSHASRVCFIPDADPPKPGEKLGPGHKFVCANGKIALAEGFGVTVKEIPLSEKSEKQDPDSFISSRKILQALEEQDFIIWYAKLLFADTETAEAKSAVVAEVATLLALIGNEVKVQMLLKQLQQLYSDKTIWRNALAAARKQNKEAQAAKANANAKMINKDLYQKYGFYMQDSSYWSIGKDGGEMRWSNFVLIPMYHIKDALLPRRIFRIKNCFHSEEIIELKQEDLCSLAKFKQKIEGLGNYVWLAKEDHLTKLKLYIYEVVTSATEITQLGWQIQGFWAFGNGIWAGSKWFTTDEYGIVKLGQEMGNYYLPAASKLYEHELKLFQFERKFVHLNLNDISLRDYAERFISVFGDNGKIGLCFLLATMFRDVVYGKTEFFPILNLFGPIGTGKSRMAEYLARFFVSDNKATNIETATIPALGEAVAQCSNAIVHLDEFKNGIDYKKIELLKSLWEGVGRSRMNMDRDKKRETTQVDAGIIMSGQEMPTADIALFSRVIFLSFQKSVFSDDEKRRFDELKNICAKGLTHLTLQILQYRAKFESEFPANYKAVTNDVQIAIRQENVIDRIRDNWCVPLAAYRSLQGVLDLPMEYKDLLAISINGIITQNNNCRSSNEIANFWNVVAYLMQDGLIYKDSDFKIKYVQRFKCDSTQLIEWSRPRPILILRKNRIFMLYKRNGKQVGDNTLPSETLAYYLENSKEYIGLKKSVRFHNIIDGQMSTMRTTDNAGNETLVKTDSIDRAYCFDYELLCENYGINLEVQAANNIDDDFNEPTPEPHQAEIFGGGCQGEAPF